VKQFLIAGTLALTFTAAQQAYSQQPIPEAPHPQANLPAVTPGLAAPNTSTSAPAGAQASDPDQAPVGTSLPTTPAATQTTSQTTDHDPAGDAPPDAGAGLTTLRLTTNFVEVPFTVKDNHGNLVPGLTWRDVRVFENGIRQHMAVFTVDPVPLSIAVVIDQSMTHDTMTRVNNALGALPAAFTPYDSVAVFTYNNSPRMQTDYTSGTSARLSAVIEQSKSTGRDEMFYDAGTALGQGINLNGNAEEHINPLTSGGPGSPQGLSHSQVPREFHTLNDAILMAGESLSHAAKGRRRIIYVISDGKELGSTAKLKQVIKYLQTNQISVYATLTGDSAIYGLGFLEKVHLPLQMRDNILPIYTNATGGQTVSEYRTPEIEKSFARIAEQVRTQYTVGYYSHEPITDGKFRTLEVRVLRPNLDVIAKKGYYPPPQAFTPTPRPTSTPQ
jgi:VWFA-related protein